MRNKIITFFMKIIFLSIIAVILSAAFNYLVDPLQFYHKAYYVKPDFYKQERFQNPGFAKNFDYDTVIIGTSMMQNFSPAYIKQKLGFDSIKLSMSGSTIAEQEMILELAIKSGKVKNVIWGLDFSSLSTKKNEVRDSDVEFPYYLYNNNIFDDYRYLFNSTTTELSITAIINKLSNKSYNEAKMLENYSNWDKSAKYGSKYAINEYKKLIEKKNTNTSSFMWDDIQWNIDNKVINIMSKNSNINFYLFYTPNSVLAGRYYYEIGQEVLANFSASKKYLVDSCNDLKNVRLYDFHSVKEIVCDLELYKDQSHHNTKVNKAIIDSIANNINTIDSKNADYKLKSFEKWVVQFNLE